MLTKKHESSTLTKYSLTAVALTAQAVCQQRIAQLEQYKYILYRNLFFCIFFL